MRKILFILFPALLFACSSEPDNVEGNIIPPEKMKDLLVEIHIIEAEMGYENIPADTLKEVMMAIYAKIFDKYEITTDDFRESFKHYTENSVIMDKIYTDVIAEIEMTMKKEKPL